MDQPGMTESRWAVKFVMPHAPDAFTAEAALLDRLGASDNIVKIANVKTFPSDHPAAPVVRGRRRAFVAIVMSYVRGTSLADVVQTGASTQREVRCWGEGMARALKAMHDLDVLHLDVKPANVIIAEQSGPTVAQAKLLDVGISAEESSAPGEPIGTAHYRSHAQWEGRRLRSSDLWSLGLILFELSSDHTILDFWRRAPDKTSSAAADFIAQEVLSHVAEVPDPVVREIIRFLLSGADSVTARWVIGRLEQARDDPGARSPEPRRFSARRVVLPLIAGVLAGFDVALLVILLVS
jgi:serine/threonine protein kinase